MNAIVQSETQESSNVTSMAEVIERVMLNPELPIDRLEKMLDMQERIQRRQEKAAHTAALASAMAVMPNIPMTGRGHNGRPYSTLKDITTTTRKPLADHGLTLTFDTQNDTQSVTVKAVLSHRLGHEVFVSITLPADTSGSKSAVQAIGSSQTYGQRYTAQSILGLSMGEDVDDDGALADKKSPIDEDQFRALQALIDETGGDDASFLKFYGIAHLAELPMVKFGHATAMLNKKIRKAVA